MHDLPLITTIAAAVTAAWLLGLLTQRLGLSPIVGYLLGGVLIGPYTPGFVGDVHLAQQLAEVGVILLMFGVGLHFHLKDLLAVSGVAIPGALGQSAVATVLGALVFAAFGVPLGTGAVIGMAMAVASTVVLMRVLMDADALDSRPGHVAVGWLLVEDMLTVIVLVVLPVLGTHIGAGDGEAAPGGIFSSVGIALLKLGVLAAILLFAGARVIPWILVQVARLRSRELFTLTILVFSVAVAAASYQFFGASMALGAFLAGMVVALSPVSYQVASDALPMRDAFAVIFFVSVGMLFDPAFVLREPLMLLAALGIILIAKPVAALMIVAVLGHSSQTALTVALGLAQIGEFSFILSAVAREHQLMPDVGHSLLVASAIISITLNPLLFRQISPIESWLQRHPRMWQLLNRRAGRMAVAVNEEQGKPAADQRLAIVVGFGPVGRSVHRLLRQASLATTIIDLNMDTISELRAKGESAIFGDATQQSILEQAGIRRAMYLILTLPQPSARLAVVAAARHLNPQLRVLVRAHYLSERRRLEEAGATAAVYEEAEAAVALARLVLADTGVHRDSVEHSLRDLRIQLILESAPSVCNQSIQTLMAPWPRVKKLSLSSAREEVLQQVAEHGVSNWPVVDQSLDKVVGYVAAKDLLSKSTAGGSWTALIRDAPTVRSDDTVETVLRRLQNNPAPLCIVQDEEGPLGLLTADEMLESVAERIQHEYGREPAALLRSAIEAGAVVLDLKATTASEAIAELAEAIPARAFPGDEDIVQAALAREREVSSDLGCGVAIPHARCRSLHTPIVVLGRSPEGIVFSTEPGALVRLVFLLITPAQRPEAHLLLLSQIAELAGTAEVRERLLHASVPTEVLDIISNSSGRSYQGT